MARPKCADEAPDLSQSKEILGRLLKIELERLDTAVQIEKDRKIVFPETSIIIRDIQKLNEAVNGTKGEEDPEEGSAEKPLFPDLSLDLE